MIDCKDLIGKVIRSFTLYDECSGGPELSIDFEDGTTFNAVLGVKTRVFATLTQSEGEEPQVLKQYTE